MAFETLCVLNALYRQIKETTVFRTQNPMTRLVAWTTKKEILKVALKSMSCMQVEHIRSKIFLFDEKIWSNKYFMTVFLTPPNGFPQKLPFFRAKKWFPQRL